MRHFQENGWKIHLGKEEVCSEKGVERESAKGFSVGEDIGYGILQQRGSIPLVKFLKAGYSIAKR